MQTQVVVGLHVDLVTLFDLDWIIARSCLADSLPHPSIRGLGGMTFTPVLSYRFTDLFTIYVNIDISATVVEMSFCKFAAVSKSFLQDIADVLKLMM